jgi:hypothetical protein
MRPKRNSVNCVHRKELQLNAAFYNAPNIFIFLASWLQSTTALLYQKNFRFTAILIKQNNLGIMKRKLKDWKKKLRKRRNCLINQLLFLKIVLGRVLI